MLDRVQDRLDAEPERMRVRRETVEHPFGKIKSWMGLTHFQMKTLKLVSTEMSMHVLAYNLKRAMSILGVKPLIRAIQAWRLNLPFENCVLKALWTFFRGKYAKASHRIRTAATGKNRLYTLESACRCQDWAYWSVFLSFHTAWVGSTRLAKNLVAYHRNVLCRPDSCHSLALEHRYVAGPARSTTGHNLPFPSYKRRARTPHKKLF